jgi:transposase-like protein
MPREKWTKAERDRAVTLYGEGRLTLKEVSTETGAPVPTLRHWCLRAGVLRNPKKAAQLAASKGRKSTSVGMTRTFSAETRAKMSAAKRRWADANARGFSVKPSGYAEVTRGPHKLRGVHRLTVEQAIGRPLLPGEVVHHIDGNKLNNDLSNLAIMTPSTHARLHATEAHHRRVRDERGRFS